MTSWNADLYEGKHSFVWKEAASLLELLKPRPGEHILDVGCGTGQLTAQIAEYGATVLGVDSSPEMIEQAQRNYAALRFELADARSLPFVAEFDAVFSNAVLHWVKEAESAIRCIVRALRPGGRFVAEFGGKGNVRHILAALTVAGESVGCSTESPWYFPSIAEYTGLLEANGFEVTFATLFDRPTPLEGESGLRHWIEMFGGHFLSPVPAERRDEYFRVVEESARAMLRRDGAWFADYRRLRVVARRLA